MKNTDLFEAIGGIDDKLIKDAKKAKRKRQRFIYYVSAAVVAVILTISILIGAILPFFTKDVIITPTSPFFTQDGTNLPLTTEDEIITQVISYPTLPKYTPQPEKFEKFALASSQKQWLSIGQANAIHLEFGRRKFNINDFVIKTAPAFLTKNDDKNYIYSPLNLFLALAMLAETTENNSRKQILEVLGYDDMEVLRKDANLLIKAHNFDDEKGFCSVANSIWLSEKYKFNQATLDKIAEIHFGESYSGDFANQEYVSAFKEWLNNSTKGILQDYVERMQVDPESVMQLASTMYFESNWSIQFDKNDNTFSIFNTPTGKIKCEFMNDYRAYNYMYWTAENYSKLSIRTESNIYLSIYLPNEGISVEEILQGGFGSEIFTNAEINLSLPKFDFSSQYDLTKTLKEIGVTDVFDSKVSDFFPIMQQDTSIPIFISAADHSARISIDENGCRAGAITRFSGFGSGKPDYEPVDFIVDRPFIFVLNSPLSSIPLLIGVVNNPCSI